MNQLKTNLDWFEEARAAGHEWADAAVFNCREQGLLEELEGSLREALFGAFFWDETTQGHRFWSNVHDTLRRNP
jgi:hypothetical protein